MLNNHYAIEKTAEIERQLAERELTRPRPAPRPLLAPALVLAGRTLRRIGEGIESWAAPGAERERPSAAEPKG